jgi:copper chaperone CopZ
MRSVDLRTQGMHCGGCSLLIEFAVGDMLGVSTVKADFEHGITHVEYDPDFVSVKDIVEVIARDGYNAEVAA